MAKNKGQQRNRDIVRGASSPAPRKVGAWWAVGVVILIAGGFATFLANRNELGASSSTRTGGKNTNTAPVLSVASTNIATMPVAQAVMVTVELDFGPKVPTIAEGLREVERYYYPDDGKGRTFAILDAYGEPTADGKLHMSMHVSTEKPGVGKLVFRKTGEVLWQSRIVLGTNPPASVFTGKDLLILIDNGTGKTFTVDGSGNPASVLGARMKETGVLVRDFWPDGDEREVTFIYSACGCPVKAKVRRTGERTTRTKELPVIFPDDPAVVSVISQLMGW